MKNNIVLSLMCIIIFNLYLFNVCFDETNGLFYIIIIIYFLLFCEVTNRFKAWRDK